jgi:hypothetical protein
VQAGYDQAMAELPAWLEHHHPDPTQPEHGASR